MDKGLVGLGIVGIVSTVYIILYLYLKSIEKTERKRQEELNYLKGLDPKNTCQTCKHERLSVTVEPCKICAYIGTVYDNHYTKWKPKYWYQKKDG